MPKYALGDLVPSIASDAYIHPDAVIIGAVTIGSGTSVWPSAVLRGDSSHITIGTECSIQDGVVIHTAQDLPTIIGNRVTIGHLAHLEGCSVDDGALIGVSSVVLHRAVIGSGALVGAGAVVTPGTVVPARATALGVPARIKPDSVEEVAFAPNLAAYREFTARYPTELRRLPD